MVSRGCDVLGRKGLTERRTLWYELRSEWEDKDILTALGRTPLLDVLTENRERRNGVGRW